MSNLRADVIRLVLDQLGPVAALEEVAAMPVVASPPIGIRREEQRELAREEQWNRKPA